MRSQTLLSRFSPTAGGPDRRPPRTQTSTAPVRGRRLWGQTAPAAPPTGSCARPNIPDFNACLQKRSILTRKLWLDGSPTGSISATAPAAFSGRVDRHLNRLPGCAPCWRSVRAPVFRDGNPSAARPRTTACQEKPDRQPRTAFARPRLRSRAVTLAPLRFSASSQRLRDAPRRLRGCRRLAFQQRFVANEVRAGPLVFGPHVAVVQRASS